LKAARFDYRRPESLAEALRLLQEGEGTAKAIAGGQSLGPMLNLRLARPATVVDISRVPELRGVSGEADGVQVGACVTHAEIEDGVFPVLRGHPLQRAAGQIAYRAIRNRGTVAGSLAHADPAADWVVIMLALGARLHLASPRGRRTLGMEEFMVGAYTTVLAADELVAAVHVPGLGSDARWGYYKFCRKTGEFAEASCAALFDPSTRTARIAIGALDGAPQLLEPLAAAVARDGMAAAGDEAVQAAVHAALPGKDAVDRRLHATAVGRCVAQAFSGEGVCA
jgi:carbon-monoxide dehydrogenase medium subunit